MTKLKVVSGNYRIMDTSLWYSFFYPYL